MLVRPSKTWIYSLTKEDGKNKEFSIIKKKKKKQGVFFLFLAAKTTTGFSLNGTSFTYLEDVFKIR